MSQHVMSSYTVYRGGIYHALSQEAHQYWPDGALVVNAEGFIEACGPWPEVEAQFAPGVNRVYEFPPHALMVPGFIDLHTHLPQLAVTGRQAENLLAWLDSYIYPEEAKFQDETYAEEGATRFFQELLRHGTTTAAVFLTSHLQATHTAFRVAEQVGNRVVMGLNLMDTGAPTSLLKPTDLLLRETEQLYHTWHGADGGRLQYAWMPRFALTSTRELLAGIGALRKQYPEVYLHTHLSEQPEEIEEVHKAFPESAHYTDLYERYGLLGPKTILAHGVHLSDDELAVLKTTDCSLAHCPSSNFFLKSGRFRLFEVMAKNLRWGLGSDVGAGPSLSMFQVMKDAQYMQLDRLLSPHLLFYAATLGAAKALMLEDTLGNFTPGKAADFVVVSDIGAGHPPSCEERLSQLIYLGGERSILKTFVQGKLRYSQEENTA